MIIQISQVQENPLYTLYTEKAGLIHRVLEAPITRSRFGATSHDLAGDRRLHSLTCLTQTWRFGLISRRERMICTRIFYFVRVKLVVSREATK